MNNIWNPVQQEFVTLNTRQGIKTLRNYLKQYVAHGGAEKVGSDFKTEADKLINKNSDYMSVKKNLRGKFGILNTEEKAYITNLLKQQFLKLLRFF